MPNHIGNKIEYGMKEIFKIPSERTKIVFGILIFIVAWCFFYTKIDSYNNTIDVILSQTETLQYSDEKTTNLTSGDQDHKHPEIEKRIAKLEQGQANLEQGVEDIKATLQKLLEKQ